MQLNAAGGHVKVDSHGAVPGLGLAYFKFLSRLVCIRSVAECPVATLGTPIVLLAICMLNLRFTFFGRWKLGSTWFVSVATASSLLSLSVWAVEWGSLGFLWAV